VIETTEGTLDTEGSDKLARGGIADVLTEFAVVAEQIAARLRAGDQTKDGNAVLFTEGIVTSTIADKLNTQDIKEIL
jgi:aspartate oxidase